jgi:hypothetical protein
MTCSDEDRDRGPGMIVKVGYSVVGRSRGHVAPCAVCTVHVETRSAGFLVEPQTKVDGLSVVWPQNHWDGFSLVLALKPMAAVCE